MATRLPGYVRRFAAVPAALAVLQDRGGPVELAELAEEVGADPESLGADLQMFLSVRSSIYHQEALVRTVETRDGSEREYFQLTTTQAAGELGVDFLPTDALIGMYVRGHEILDIEPGNDALARALDKLEQLLVPPDIVPDPTEEGGHVSLLRDAVAGRRKVRLEYSKAWRAGVDTRIVEPYQLLRTHRGWEVDAGQYRSKRQAGDAAAGTPDPAGAGATQGGGVVPLAQRGAAAEPVRKKAAPQIRTFLVSHIRSVEVMDEHFERPADAAQLCATNRAQKPARVLLPPKSDWVVERFAEKAEIIQDDDGDKMIDVELAEPVRQRLALMLLIAGKGAELVEPLWYSDADAELAARLLQIYSGTDPERDPGPGADPEPAPGPDAGPD